MALTNLDKICLSLAVPSVIDLMVGAGTTQPIYEHIFGKGPDLLANTVGIAEVFIVGYVILRSVQLFEYFEQEQQKIIYKSRLRVFEDYLKNVNSSFFDEEKEY